MIVAELPCRPYQHGHQFAVTRLQSRVAVDVDDLELEARTSLQFAQPGDHVIAQMAVRAAVNRELDGAWRT